MPQHVFPLISRGAKTGALVSRSATKSSATARSIITQRTSGRCSTIRSVGVIVRPLVATHMLATDHCEWAAERKVRHWADRSHSPRKSSVSGVLGGGAPFVHRQPGGSSTETFRVSAVVVGRWRQKSE